MALTGMHVKLLEAYQTVLAQLRPAPAASEPAAPAPAAPEPSTSAPAAPEPSTSAPAAPEPSTFEPAAPEPSTFEPAAPEPVAPEPSTFAEVTLSVGPFRSTDAVRAFARALSGIPGVREVAVRGYDGENRAIVDVQLTEPSS